MSAVKVAYRYAKSIIDLAEEQDKLEEVYNDFKYFNKAVSENKDLYNLLKSPVIGADKKNKIFEALFKEKISDMTYAFFKIVINKGREKYLPEIATAFEELYNREKGIVAATLVTATPVSDELKQKIRQLIKDQNNANEVELDYKVEGDIIGGFILKYNNNLYDASVSHQLKELRKEFSNKEYIKAI